MAVLNDAAAYFGALRSSLLLARQQVYIIGWDIHSQTRLVGASARADDGFPEELGPFLRKLLTNRPELRINILIWDFAALYAAEREWNSVQKFTSGAPDRLRICFDSSLPLGSAQHQKIVAIDNSVAFVGGLDLTIRRWDTSEHLPVHPLRCDPEGRAYPPFHDVQCMVDGEAAATLAELAEQRWQAAGCAIEGPRPVPGDRWPVSVPIHAEGIPTGVARTEIQTASRRRVNEVERLFEACINAANRFIYIENQFTSATDLARILAERMLRVPSLRVLIVTPKLHSSWLESQSMQNGRGGFIDRFVAADVMERIRIVHPSSRDERSEAAVMVHSKLMIVDDDILRIGSANLNNRSMGADTECDLVFEASSDDHRKFVAGLRRQLIGHFCGAGEKEIENNEADLFAFLDKISASGRQKSLKPIETCPPTSSVASLVQPVADPKQPLNLERAASRMWTAKTILGVSGISIALIGLSLVWYYSSLSDFADVGFISSLISPYSQSTVAPLLAIAAFVIGGLVIFPVLVLIAATAAALGPWLGFLSATAGVLLSAAILFAIGRALGHRRLQRLLGPRASRVQGRIVGRGILAVAIIRMVPVAPFSIVNVVAGASKLSARDFLIGTILGMTPGILAMAALGSQIADLARSASWTSALLLALAIAGWIAICLGAQFLVTWLAGRQT
ncbi:MAG: VTT domain-containing protein [Bradyrhizobium sp.]|nr:VTT domain-containing protein [Bradyrhizobium sp.]